MSSDCSPLAGVKVLDLSQIVAGPYCTRLLSDAGANVLKLEPPSGDPSRSLPIELADAYSGFFTWLNCGKVSGTCDLRTEAGRDLVRSLARQADIFIENMRPGSLAAKGLGYAELRELNPDVIFCSISAFGSVGPLASSPGQGVIAEGYAGITAMNGFPDRPPVPVGVSVADISAGIHAYGAIMTALFRRQRTGQGGERIDISLFRSALPFHESALEEVEFSGGETVPNRSGLDHRSVVPYGVFAAPDGYLTLAAGTEPLWVRLDEVISAAIGASMVDLSTNAQRLRHRTYVRERIEAWAAALGGVREALSALAAAGVPSGPVRSVAEVANTEPAVSSQSFISVPDPVLGSANVLNTPFSFSESYVSPRGGAPLLGEHTGIIEACARGEAEWPKLNR